jgi:hypothetical protein
VTTTDERPFSGPSQMPEVELPRWSVADVHESLDARSFTDALERAGADAQRLVALFDELGIRAIEHRPVTADDASAADRALRELNRVTDDVNLLRVYVYATVATDSRDQRGPGAVQRDQATRCDAATALVPPGPIGWRRSASTIWRPSASRRTTIWARCDDWRRGLRTR